MPEFRAMLNVTAIALTCAIALAATHRLTGDRIRFNETAQLREAVARLLPDGVEPPSRAPDLGSVPAAWRLCDGYLLARSDARGYGGEIRLLYTLREGEKVLTGLTVLGHAETPGIADFVTDAAWLETFTSRSPTDIERLSAVTGATITSRAVARHLAAVLRDGDAVLGNPETLACGE